MRKKRRSQEPIDLAAYMRMFEQFLADHGVNPEGVRMWTPESPFVVWGIGRGSTMNYVFLEPGEDTPSSTFTFVTPLLTLPPDQLLPFYRRCLELNGESVCGALAVHQNVVYVILRQFLAGIDPALIGLIFDSVSGFADHVDDELITEFGAVLVGQLPDDWFFDVLQMDF